MGKTCLVERFINHKVPSNITPTLGHEFFQKIIVSESGYEMAVQIWDTAGQEKYKALSTSHYKGAHGAILVFDLTRDLTFRNTVNWLSEFKMHASPNAKVTLVGNKLDLVEMNSQSRCIEKKSVLTMAQINKINYIETSAAVDKNVTQAFNSLIQEIINGGDVGPGIPGIKLTDYNQYEEAPEDRSENCCE